MTVAGELREAYYHRVRPVVGERLRGRCVGLLQPGQLATAADALARSGVLRWRVAPGPPVRRGGPLARALGERWVGQRAGAAFVQHLREHNRWEDRWDLRLVEHPERAREVDLLLGAGPPALGLCRAAETPSICLLPLRRGASYAVLAMHPRLPSAEAFLEPLVSAAASPGESAAHTLDALEGGDVLASLARGLLLDTALPGGLAERMLRTAAPLVVRGSAAWPWEVALVRPAQAQWLRRLLARRLDRPGRTPLAGRRVLIVGCGTASNWIPELWASGAALTLVDAKPFSLYNPVRQLAGTDFVDDAPKPVALQRVLERREGHEGDTEPVTRRCHAVVLRVSLEDPASLKDYRTLLDRVRPDLAVVGTGRSQDDNFPISAELRRRGVPHMVPTAFPGVTHFKHIVVDGLRGPSYDELQNHLPVDRGPGPRLDEAARQLYYGGTQPATLVETLPSVHSGLRLLEQLALPPAARAAWFLRLQRQRRTCLVGANRVETRQGMPLYGVEQPCQVVAYGADDVTAPEGGGEEEAR